MILFHIKLYGVIEFGQKIGTKSLLEAMLTYHQRGSLPFNWGLIAETVVDIIHFTVFES